MRCLVFAAPLAILAVGFSPSGAGADETSDILKFLQKHGVQRDWSRPKEGADLKELLRDQIVRCYGPPVTENAQVSVVVTLRVNRDGSLAEPPTLSGGASARGQAALRAIQRCTPFKIPDEFAQRYDEWREMRITFE